MIKILSLFLSFLGFLDASYLTILHYKHVTPPCSVTHGCEFVLTSQYATIGNLPISLIGSFYYTLLLILLGLSLQGIKKISFIQFSSKLGNWLLQIDHLIYLLVISSLFVSLYLLYLQMFVIHAFCQFCLGVEAVNILTFILLIFPRL